MEKTRKSLYNRIVESDCYREVEVSAGRLKDEMGVQEYDIDLAPVFSKLIKEAAKCDIFSSDIISVIEGIKSYINNLTPKEYDDDTHNIKNIICGFKKRGIDTDSVVRYCCIYNDNNPAVIRQIYRQIYKICIRQEYNVISVHIFSLFNEKA